MLDIIDQVRANPADEIHEQQEKELAMLQPPEFIQRTSLSENVQIQQIPQLINMKEDEQKECLIFQISSPVVVPEAVVVQEEENEDAEPLAFCDKSKKCGHSCKGVSGERKCLPCLSADCVKEAGLFDGTNEDELCTICYTSELGTEPCSKLSCGHVFHTNCVVQLLKHKWTSLRITFAFMSCPSCKQELELKGVSREVAAELGPLKGLKQ